MKRSDAVIDLAGELIISFCDNGLSPPAFDKAQYVAEDLLKKIEQLELAPIQKWDDEYL